MIKQEIFLTDVLGNIDSDNLGTKEDRKKRVMEAEDQRKNKPEQNQRRYDDDRSEVILTCGVLVHLVLEFGMYLIKKPKVKDLRVLIHYHFGSEKLKGRPKKLGLVEVITQCL